MNVFIWILIASSLVSYSGTHCVAMPPGFSRVLHDRVVLARKQDRVAAHPRVDRVGGDDVELLARRRQEVARVVEHDLPRAGSTAPRSSPSRTALAAPTTRGSISQMTIRFTSGWSVSAPAVMPAPRPTTSTVSGRGCTSADRWPSRRSSAQVVRVVGRLDPAGDVEVAVAAGRDVHAHGRRRALGDVRVLVARVDPPDVAAVGLEHGRQRRAAARPPPPPRQRQDRRRQSARDVHVVAGRRGVLLAQRENIGTPPTPRRRSPARAAPTACRTPG